MLFCCRMSFCAIGCPAFGDVVVWPTSQGFQIQAIPILSPLYPSLISFSSFTFPGAPYRIFLPFLLWLPCYFYLIVVTEQLQLVFTSCLCHIMVVLFKRWWNFVCASFLRIYNRLSYVFLQNTNSSPTLNENWHVW